MKLDVKAFALTSGLLWGVGLFGMTWWIILFEGSSTAPGFLGLIYRGYSVTPLGSLVGLLWGVPDAAVGGAIFAWLYNRLADRGGNRAV